MTRYIIIGAGAVGASLAAEFETHGIAYVVVGRGAQIEHIARHGLTYRRPNGTRQIRLQTADTSTPPALNADDVLVLTVKTQDVEAATAFWAWQPVEGGGLASALPQSTWQSFTRGTSSEVDYLNGEIVRLARLNGIPAPLNEALQQAVARLSLDGGRPGSVKLETVM